ncbi:MAG: hypothetical protein SFY68_04970 [Candidatus Sumerlaeia bacterium]|nr:hypothetical protein [Candidatus Sumerlaeia bacterium]
MAFPKRQNPLDWMTQLGHIILGRRIVSGEDDWLLGPIGAIGEKVDQFISRIAKEHDLQVATNRNGVGLLNSFEDFGLTIKPKIDAFYRHTSDYELDAWTEWKFFFKPFGYIVAVLFSKRIQQLYLPLNSLETSEGIKSEIIQLVDNLSNVVYCIWHRQLKTSKDVIFYGIYTYCLLPSGKPAIKAIFPLPQGNATAIFGIGQDQNGNLELTSFGNTYGDPGLYILVEDSRGNIHKNYIRFFHQLISVYEDKEGIIRADHTMDFCSFRIHKMHYKIVHKLERTH